VTIDAPPRRFFAVATGAGLAFSGMAISVPLHVVAAHRDAATAGDILAAATVAIAAGAAAAGTLAQRLRGGPRVLAAALAVVAAGTGVLAAATGIALLALGAVVVGAGIGLFWVASQLILSRRAGMPGSARGFLHHYASYTAGGVAGSALTGALANGAQLLGLSTLTGLRIASLTIAAVTVSTLALWRRCVRDALVAAPPADRVRAQTLAMQVPDLLLVGALALLLPLAPVVLAREFHLSPFATGIVMAGVALSKIAGTVAARLISQASGQRRTVLILLLSGACFSLLLCTALTLSVFVAALFTTALVTTGAWPLVVDAAQARVDPSARRSLTVLWNTREYTLIAAMTAISGWLLTTLGTAAPVFALAAAMFATAAATSAAVLRRPLWHADGA
jgi:MFS family permease